MTGRVLPPTLAMRVKWVLGAVWSIVFKWRKPPPLLKYRVAFDNEKDAFFSEDELAHLPYPRIANDSSKEG